MKKRHTLRYILAGLAWIIIAGVAEANAALYSTSFEDLATGILKTVEDQGATWKSLGKSEVTTQFHRTGDKCLRLFGGTDNTLEIALSGALQDCRGIEFHAERWTSQPPFKFRLQAQVAGEWKEVSNLDQIVAIGRGFQSHVVAKLPEGRKTALRLVTSAPADKGTLIDDLKLLKDEPTNVSKVPAPPKVSTDPINKLIYDDQLFSNGTLDTKVFRIPAIITAVNGDLIATCDARRDHGADLNGAQDIDIAIRRSSNNGKTWTDMELVCDLGEGHPASDPSLILDETTGEIFCFYNYMDRSKKKEYRLYVQSSKDNGETWGEPRDITDEITLPEWKYDFKFMTSGRGVQRRSGELLHTLVRVGKGVHLFGSKDHGKSWYLKIKEPLSPADESKVIELADESLMVNCRVNGGYGARHIHVSDDDGVNWTDRRDAVLVDPGCNGAILRYTSVEDGYAKNRLIFSNASSGKGRKNLAVRISYDEGKTWSDGKVITSGTAMYSDLTICPDGTIGILYEPGNGVRFTSITLEDLTDGKDKLSKPYTVPGS
jgi:sialidase-1